MTNNIAKVLVAAVLSLGVGGGVAIGQASDGRDDPAGDVRGPCDEAEHANDPRCATGTTAATTTTQNTEPNDDRRKRKRHRGANRGRSGTSGHSGPGRSGSSGRG